MVEALGWGQKSRVSAAANPLRTKVPEFMTHTNGYNARSAAKQRVTQQYVRREGHEGRCNVRQLRPLAFHHPAHFV
jgi:hypothetical protein